MTLERYQQNPQAEIGIEKYHPYFRDGVLLAHW
jgi:hypothetical protein